MNVFDEIERLAYELFLQSGRIPGRCLENWLEAERIVLSRVPSQQEVVFVEVTELPEAQKSKGPVKKAVTKKPAAKAAAKKALPSKSSVTADGAPKKPRSPRSKKTVG